MKFALSRTLVSLSLVLGAEAWIVNKEGDIVGADAKRFEAKMASVAHHTGAAALAVQGHKAVGGKIVPPLVDVESDKKFFGPPFPADYPDDVQPPAKRKLFSKTVAYPKVQAEDKFDQDFVKDENSDGGKWQAQQDYDAARTKIANKKRQAENAAKRAAKEGKAAEAAAKKLAEKQRKEEEAAKEAEQADGTEKSERDAEKRARDNVVKKQADHEKTQAEREAKAAQEEADNKKTAEERQKEMEERVRDADKALAKQKESYADCEKKLEEAKARVKALEAEQKGLNSDNQDSSKKVKVKAADVEEEKKAVTDAQAKTIAAEKAHQETLEKLEAAHHEAEAAKKELARQKAEKEAAQAAEAKVEKEEKEAEKELADSRSRLRRARGPNALPAGEEGPSTTPPKAGAVGVGRSAVVAVAVAALLFM